MVVMSESATFDIYDDSEKLVALTFDDGPKEGKTEPLLDMLNEKGVHATFFIIGAQVEENSEIVRRMYEEGHQIGMHTYSHVDLSCLSEARQKEEIEKSRKVIETVIGAERLLLRPPFGKLNQALENWLDCPMILWSVDTDDGLAGAAGIIDELRRMGYTFLTVDELFACRNIELEDGITYRRAR